MKNVDKMMWCCGCVRACAFSKLVMCCSVKLRSGRLNRTPIYGNRNHSIRFGICVCVCFALEWMWSKKCDVIKIIKVKNEDSTRTKKWHFFPRFFLSASLVLLLFTIALKIVGFHRTFWNFSTNKRNELNSHNDEIYLDNSTSRL